MSRPMIIITTGHLVVVAALLALIWTDAAPVHPLSNH